VIEQAKGVIMSSLGCSDDAAFAVLVQQSQFQNRKLWEIAEELVAVQDRSSGTAPDQEPSEGVTLESLPIELADRVRAAIGRAGYRRIERVGEVFTVYGLSGDRLVIMELELRPESSVREVTDIYLRSELVNVEVQGGAGIMEVTTDGRYQRRLIPAELAELLRS
jgi:hypothetical protein